MSFINAPGLKPVLPLQSCRFCQIHPEPFPSPLIAAGHFGRSVTELFLDVAFIHLSAAGEAGAERMARVALRAFSH